MSRSSPGSQDRGRCMAAPAAAEGGRAPRPAPGAAPPPAPALAHVTGSGETTSSAFVSTCGQSARAWVPCTAAHGSHARLARAPACWLRLGTGEAAGLHAHGSWGRCMRPSAGAVACGCALLPVQHAAATRPLPRCKPVRARGPRPTHLVHGVRRLVLSARPRARDAGGGGGAAARRHQLRGALQRVRGPAPARARVCQPTPAGAQGSRQACPAPSTMQEVNPHHAAGRRLPGPASSAPTSWRSRAQSGRGSRWALTGPPGRTLRRCSGRPAAAGRTARGGAGARRGTPPARAAPGPSSCRPQARFACALGAAGSARGMLAGSCDCHPASGARRARAHRTSALSSSSHSPLAACCSASFFWQYVLQYQANLHLRAAQRRRAVGKATRCCTMQAARRSDACLEHHIGDASALADSLARQVRHWRCRASVAGAQASGASCDRARRP